MSEGGTVWDLDAPSPGAARRRTASPSHQLLAVAPMDPPGPTTGRPRYRMRVITAWRIIADFVLFTVIVVLIGTGWSLLFHFGLLPDVPIDRTPLRHLDIVVGFQFVFLLNEARHRYTVRPRLYRKLLLEIRRVADQHIGLLEFRGRVLPEPQSRELRHLVVVLQMMVCLALDLFLPGLTIPGSKARPVWHDRHLIQLVENAKDGDTVQVMLNSLARLAPIAAFLKTARFYTAADIIALNDSKAPLRTILNEIDIAERVVTPSIFRTWLFIAIAIYFAVIPATLWHFYRWWTPLVFFFTMVIVWGVWIIGRRLTDPFVHQLKGSRHMDFIQWRDDELMRIDNAIELTQPGLRPASSPMHDQCRIEQSTGMPS